MSVGSDHVMLPLKLPFPPVNGPSKAIIRLHFGQIAHYTRRLPRSDPTVVSVLANKKLYSLLICTT